MATNILFITANRLGDGVLSLGAMDELLKLYPDAAITVACGPLVAGLFKPVPGVVGIIPLVKKRWKRHWFDLFRQTIGTRWDVIVDLRDSMVSRLLPARQKFIWRKGRDQLHKVQQIGAVLGALATPLPRFWFDQDKLDEAARLVPRGGPVLAVGPTANWIGKIWPPEYFIELISRLTAPDGPLPEARVMVLAAPGEEIIARQVLDAVPPGRRIDMIAKAPPLLAAAAIARADLYIGNDSGLTHAAAATGIPTLALFGYGWPDLYRPWGAQTAYVSTPETPEQLLAGRPLAEVKETLMRSLTVTAAYAAAVDLWEKSRK